MEFNTLLKTTLEEQITPIEESFATEGYGYSVLALNTRLQKMIDAGNTIAPDLKNILLRLSMQPTGRTD
ncbi:hypothetical protein [Aliamphritea spongicola]|nr:hypothetical protein [Aliamphritea spongicola]